MQKHLVPHEYQERVAGIVVKSLRQLVLLDMGLGKTVIILKALEELMFNRLEVQRVLVIAPLRVALTVWEAESVKWGLPFKISKVLGTAAKRLKALDARSDIYVINRENTAWLVDYLKGSKKEGHFDAIVIDESSSFKNHKSIRFKKLRTEALKAKRVYALTGTPAPNGLLDLWSQVYLLDGGLRLGERYTKYVGEFFLPDKRNQQIVFSYKLKPFAETRIHERIADISIRLRAEDYLKMPEKIENVIRLHMDGETQKRYDVLERDYFLAMEQGDVAAASAGVLVTKLLQLANGAVYDEDGEPIHIHDIKLDALEELLECNEGIPFLVLYKYKHDLSRLQERFKKVKPRQLNTEQDERDWNAGKIRLLLAHPASIGHGLNIQYGKSTMVWFGLTWSLEEKQQTVARLYRQGREHLVVIHYLVMAGTVDEDVMDSLQRKDDTQDNLLKALKEKWLKYQREDELDE